MRPFRKYQPRPGTLLSVALLIAVHPPIEWTMLVWVALVPWLSVVHRSPTRTCAVVQSMWLQMLVGFGWGFWLPSAVADFFSMPIWAGALALLANASIHHLHILPFAWMVRWSAEPAVPASASVRIALLAATYCGLDWLLPGVFQHGLGAALHDLPRLRQLAGFGGVAALTFVVVLANLAIYSVWESFLDVRSPRRDRLRTASSVTLVLVIVMGAAWLYGGARYRALKEASAGTQRLVRVGLVQGNVDDEVKRRWRSGDQEAANRALGIYVRQTESLLASETRPDLVIWPETAYPGLYRLPETEGQARLNAAFDRFIHDANVPFVFGAYGLEVRMDRRALLNSLFFVEPRPGQARTELSPAHSYAKSILFPLGETLPWIARDHTERLFATGGRFARGDGPAVHAIRLSGPEPRVNIGPLICYEDLFTNHTAALARLGAELLVNVSNDGWFGDFGAPRLHLIYAKLRSVELGLPQVRVTNTGYSAVIEPSGDLIFESGYGERVSVIVPTPIPIQLPLSLVARWGDWAGVMCLASAGLAWMVVVARLSTASSISPEDSKAGSASNADTRPPEI